MRRTCPVKRPPWSPIPEARACVMCLCLQAAQEGALELRDVYFSYPVRPEVPVLKGLSLTFPKGSVTALVGRSGAGKSTVGALISRCVDTHIHTHTRTGAMCVLHFCVLAV